MPCPELSKKLVEETDQSTKIPASHLNLGLLVPSALQIPSDRILPLNYSTACTSVLAHSFASNNYTDIFLKQSLRFKLRMQKAYPAPHNRENLSSKSMQSYFILARKSKAPSCKYIKFPCLCNKLQNLACLQ